MKVCATGTLNGDNGPFIAPFDPAFGGIWHYNGDAPNLAYDMCGSTGIDTFIIVYDDQNELNRNDDCSDDPTYGGGSTPNASCYPVTASPWEACTCAPNTNPAYGQWIRKFKNVITSNKLSLAALETLAIVAYNQPIIKAEIEQIRGVNADGVIKTLLDRRLIRIMGRKEVAGKPLLYGTTREFLQYFGLKDLSALPTLREFQELEAGEEIMEEVRVEQAGSREETPEEAAPSPEEAPAGVPAEENVTG